MTKEQLIEIAKSGFPKTLICQIDFDNSDIFVMSNVYRLYDKDVEFGLVLPLHSIMSIDYRPEEYFVQFVVGNRCFNHLSALKKMSELGLI